LDVAPTDDNYYSNINKQLPMGCTNGLAYVDDGYGAVLKIQFVKKGYGKYAKSTKEGEEDEKEAIRRITHSYWKTWRNYERVP